MQQTRTVLALNSGQILYLLDGCIRDGQAVGEELERAGCAALLGCAVGCCSKCLGSGEPAPPCVPSQREASQAPSLSCFIELGSSSVLAVAFYCGGLGAFFLYRRCRVVLWLHLFRSYILLWDSFWLILFLPLTSHSVGTQKLH